MLATGEERIQVRRDSETSITSTVTSTSSSSAINGQRDSQRILDHVNVLLADNDEVIDWLPLTLTGEDGHAFYNAVKNGLLLCELITHLVPTAINKNRMHRDFSNPNKSLFFMLENQGKVLTAAQKIGCKLVNVSPSDMVEGKGYLVLSVIWQILKNGLITRVLNAAPPTAAKSEGHDSAEALVPEVEDDPEFDTTVDEADLALIRLISTAVRPISPNVRRVAVLLEDTELMSDMFQQAGVEEEMIQDFSEIEEPTERAKMIVKIGKALLGDHSMILAKDILNGNSEMIIIFLATLLERILEKRNHKEEAHVEDENIQGNEHAEHLKKQIELYKEEIDRLVEENDCLGDRIVGLQAEMEGLKSTGGRRSSGTSDSASVVGVETDASAPLTDNIFRAQRPPSQSLDKNIHRLRQIYQHTTNFESICQAIYGDLSLQALQMGSNKCGPLKKKDRNSMKWRNRFMVLQDNFLFIFKDTAKPRDRPVDILRVDDALVRIMFEVQNMADPVISVEIASKINPFFAYLSGPASDLTLWKDAIIKSSTWWTDI